MTAGAWRRLGTDQQDGRRYIGGWWRDDEWIIAPVEWKKHPLSPTGLYGWHVCDIGDIRFILVVEPTHYLAVDMDPLPIRNRGAKS